RPLSQKQAAATITSSCFERRPSAVSLPEAAQANNLLDTHDLNTRDFESEIVRDRLHLSLRTWGLTVGGGFASSLKAH
ncbi:hypothetical protein IGI04_004867, partial [Brassica rapa subsp. trilocularis]